MYIDNSQRKVLRNRRSEEKKGRVRERERERRRVDIMLKYAGNISILNSLLSAVHACYRFIPHPITRNKEPNFIIIKLKKKVK